MSAGWIILGLALAVYAYVLSYLLGAARRAGERAVIIYVCIIAWPVAACRLAAQIAREVWALWRSGRLL